jgi:hypothetical protein
MKHAVVDSVGVVMLASVAALPLGCIPTVVIDPQPLIAVGGNYALFGKPAGPAPAPAPAPGGCDSGCKCNGTGKEPSGDGLAVVNCRCPEGCKCKPKGSTVCVSGSCQVKR